MWNKDRKMRVEFMAEGNGIYHRQNKSVCLLEGKSRGIDKTKKNQDWPRGFRSMPVGEAAS